MDLDCAIPETMGNVSVQIRGVALHFKSERLKFLKLVKNYTRCKIWCSKTSSPIG